jgi:hypothetical protein
MENSSSSPRKNELVESMFKSLNSYTSELQQGQSVVLFCFLLFQKFSFFEFKELEILNRKLAEQIRIEQTYDKSQEECMIT